MILAAARSVPRSIKGEHGVPGGSKQDRADAIKVALKRASGFQHDELLDELRAINRKLAKVAKEAVNADMVAMKEFGGLR